MSLFLSDSISDRVPVINSFFKSGASGCLSKDRYRPCEYLNSEYLDTPTQIKQKSYVKIDDNIENESYSTTWVDPKTLFEAFPNRKNSPLGPQKVKNDPKIKSKWNIRIEKKN